MGPAPAPPLATLSLDLDNEWSYLKIHGDSEWLALPSYLATAVPRFLSLFSSLGAKATVFVVGKDCALDENISLIKSIAAAGHEIGNHSYSHEPWFGGSTTEIVEREIAQAEELIESATGVRPTGFRAPGYAISGTILRTLALRNYSYDASILPSFIGPISRAYYFRVSTLKREDLEKRGGLFGSFGDGTRPNKPFVWDLSDSTLLEIPITTFPGLRIPIHFSYLLYISRYSPILARLYLWSALSLCKTIGIGPSLLLHPLDLLGKDDLSSLKFFPGMDIESSAKRERVCEYLDMLKSYYHIVPLGELAKSLILEGQLQLRKPA